MSTSARPTLRPRARRATARLTATVDFPTPPLPLATATILFTPSMRGWRETGGFVSGMAGHLPREMKAIGHHVGQREEGLGGSAAGLRPNHRRTGIAGLAHRADQGNGPQQRDAEAVGHPCRAAVPED